MRSHFSCTLLKEFINLVFVKQEVTAYFNTLLWYLKLFMGFTVHMTVC